MHYVEYRNDNSHLPLGYKFYKKTLSTKKGYSTLSNEGNKTSRGGDPLE